MASPSSCSSCRRNGRWEAGVLLFIHGGVWIAGNFENHKRLLRDLVLQSGQIGVFVEYTPLPAAKFPPRWRNRTRH